MSFWLHYILRRSATKDVSRRILYKVLVAMPILLLFLYQTIMLKSCQRFSIGNISSCYYITLFSTPFFVVVIWVLMILFLSAHPQEVSFVSNPYKWFSNKFILIPEYHIICSITATSTSTFTTNSLQIDVTIHAATK